MPNATPGFSERTMLKNPGITVFSRSSRQMGFHHPFRPAIQRKHAERDQESRNGLRCSHSPSISRLPPAHAAQTVGIPASEPTSSVYFQQRSHLMPRARSIATSTPPLA